MRAVIYARYSSDNQRDESIDAQLRICTDYARLKGYDIVGQYIDRALTGRTDDRPDFRRMLEDSKRCIFDAVLVLRVDRFSRDRRDYYNYKYRLAESGVQIDSVHEPLGDSPEEQLMEGIFVSYSQYYSDKLSSEVNRGMDENALACRHTGGLPPLGYDVVPKELTYCVNDREAEVVRTIFRMYADGSSYDQIIDHLNGLGHRTKTGGKFGRNSLHDLLANPKYIGVYQYRKTPAKRKGQPRNNHARNPGVITIEGGMPRIIDQNTWERVQRRMSDNKRNAAYGAKTVYLLSGKLYCGMCGRAMPGNSISNGYHAYICSGKKQHHDCAKANVNKERIEALVLSHVVEFLRADAEETARAMCEAQSGIQVTINPRRQVLEELLRETVGKIDNLVRAIEDGLYTSSTKDALMELEGQRDRLQDELAHVAVVDRSTRMTYDQILDQMHHLMELTDDPDSAKLLIGTFVRRVYLWDDHLKIIMQFGADEAGKDAELGPDFGDDAIESSPNPVNMDTIGGGDPTPVASMRYRVLWPYIVLWRLI